MWAAIASIIASLLEKVGWRWWQGRKTEEANEAQAKDMSDSDAVAQQLLRDKFTRE